MFKYSREEYKSFISHTLMESYGSVFQNVSKKFPHECATGENFKN